MKKEIKSNKIVFIKKDIFSLIKLAKEEKKMEKEKKMRLKGGKSG